MNIDNQDTYPEMPRALLCLSVSVLAAASLACYGTPAEPTDTHNRRVMSLEKKRKNRLTHPKCAVT